MVIDVHTHHVPKGWPDLGWPGAPRLRVDSEREATILVRDREFRRIQDDCWDPRVRLARMDEDGVDRQVVSPTPVFFGYDRTPAEGVRISRVFNDLALEICRDPRLIPFCQVPLQDPGLACAELDRCLAGGHRGVEIGNHVGDRDLDDPGVAEFLVHCAERNVPVFVHPWDMAGGRRVENAWHRRHDLVGGCERPPSHYLGRFGVDSAVFDERALRLLVDTLGEDHVMLGSDFPYPLGESPAGELIRNAGFLSGPARTKLLGANAEVFLG
ncbi:amidohydrolase family protein [Nonomuraea spiralis]|uniref:2-amino-3-carboxymuconate-6-semialdehyde decarboxylase n=1 Tax=Nonomuraea spiralis TaxID=46182 RepID=A0ABV5ICU1_9ACTN|nr:amidohydrolase family protein [Nonomuraea spiralis]GGT21062.1 amidohydrolase [Nonomuraea spiralis]